MLRLKNRRERHGHHRHKPSHRSQSKRKSLRSNGVRTPLLRGGKSICRILTRERGERNYWTYVTITINPVDWTLLSSRVRSRSTSPRACRMRSMRKSRSWVVYESVLRCQSEGEDMENVVVVRRRARSWRIWRTGGERVRLENVSDDAGQIEWNLWGVATSERPMWRTGGWR